MIVDCHNHIGYRKGEYFSADEMISWMDNAAVDMCVVFAQLEAIDNDYVAASVQEYPDRLIGWIVLDPWEYGAEEELSRCVTELGLRGLKLNPSRHGFALDRHNLLDPIFQICAKKNLPILSHGASDLFSMPAKFESMARAFPDVTLIMAHMGLPDAFHTALRAAKKYPNLFLNTAGVPPAAIAKAIAAVGAEKILMGTDAPWGRFELSIEAVKRATSDPVERELIMGKNILSIIGMH